MPALDFMEKNESKPLKLKVTEALGKDVGRALARIGPEDMEQLGVAIGDTVEVAGKRKTVSKVMPAYKDLRGRSGRPGGGVLGRRRAR